MIGALATVALIDHDAGIVWVRYGNGAIGTLDPDDGPTVSVGTLVLVNDDEFVAAPAGLLPPPPPNIGVVRRVEEGRTLIAAGGALLWVAHARPANWAEWSTVEWGEDGIIGQIDEKPIRYHDDPPTSAVVHSRFRVAPGQVTETFDGIRGLDEQIKELRQIVALLRDAAQLEEDGYRPVRGLLLAGESGTGKTMLARALSNEADATFFQVRGPEIASKWVNESEETLRALLDEADECERAIVFFDEIDSFATARSSSAHEMTNKLITQLLSMMDGFKSGHTLIVGATNRPDALDPTLLRSGRFDRRIDFPLPDQDARAAILSATKPNQVHDGIDFEALASLTAGWCSADLRGLWTEARQFAQSEDRVRLLESDCRVALERMHGGIMRRRRLIEAGT